MATELTMPKPASEPTVKGPEMNDRDRLNDVLSMEKYLTSGYNTGLNELQNPKLRQTIQNVFNDVHATQWQTFDLMFQNGWYKMKVAEPQEISQKFTQFSNYSSQFPAF